jgi:hypothetical protein
VIRPQLGQVKKIKLQQLYVAVVSLSGNNQFRPVLKQMDCEDLERLNSLLEPTS